MMVLCTHRVTLTTVVYLYNEMQNAKTGNTGSAKAKNLNTLFSDCMYRTEDYEIKRWAFNTRMNQVHGWNDCFCFVLVANGEYSFNISKNRYNTYTGHVIIEKPNFEYSLLPTTGRCTIINFSNDFYDKLCNEPGINQHAFFFNKNIISQLLLSNPVIDYLHYKLLSINKNSCRLEIDDTVFELVHELLNGLAGFELQQAPQQQYPNHQLPVIERAKEYMHQHFKNDISLQQIAANCYASAFHFSRLFRKFTLQTPYQYLLNVRLKHSEVLLKNTAMPISEVAFCSGFSGPDYFATAFKKKYKLMPTDYRKKAVVSGRAK
ncbi:MAG: helix-turn-helix transcriptional regulator [Dinghuibacter sp.]|nr:helix-turn-helix transcriptional regulator [Dinghuibacter sp.]